MKKLLNIKKLKQDLPHWSWKAIKNGFSWKYEGTCNESKVTIMPFAVFRGPNEDDFTIQWRVCETDEPYLFFYFKESLVNFVKKK